MRFCKFGIPAKDGDHHVIVTDILLSIVKLNTTKRNVWVDNQILFHFLNNALITIANVHLLRFVLSLI